MKLLIMLFLLFYGLNNVKAQNCETVYDSLWGKEFYIRADSFPVYGQSEEDLVEFLSANLKVHNDCISIYDKLDLVMVIDSNGQVVEVKIQEYHEWSENDYFDILILKILELKWRPAICSGRRVPFRLTVPIDICFDAFNYEK